MKRISIKQAQQVLHRQLKHRSPVETTLYTFKQDRSVTISCREDGLHIDESGYRKQRIVVSDPGHWKHAVKEALNIEFPRSKTVYITNTN